MTEPLDLDAIKRRCEVATSGPWKRIDGCIYSPADPDPQRCEGQKTHDVFCLGHDYDMYGRLAITDAEFIAHAREDIPALLAEVARLRAVVASPEQRFFEALVKSQVELTPEQARVLRENLWTLYDDPPGASCASEAPK